MNVMKARFIRFFPFLFYNLKIGERETEERV